MVALVGELACQFLVGGMGDDALIVDDGEDANVLHVDDVNAVLVVGEGNVLSEDTLCLVLELF